MHDAATESPERYQIGDLVVDTGSRRVFRGSKRLKFGALTFDLLVVLIKHAPALATYDQIAEEVWSGRSVSAETIAQRAKLLRKALSDDAKNPRYFELIRGQGYRLLVDVSTADTEPHRPVRWVALAALAAGAVALALLGTVFLNSEQETPSIAVLPFADMSANGDQRYLADGIAEEVLSQLARLDGLDVVSRTESFYWQQPIDDLQAIGKALNVSAILEGSVRRAGDELRVTVQLIDVDSGFHLWTENYDRRMQDLLTTQEDIAAAVAGALGIQLGVGNVSSFPGAGTSDIKAYEAYLQGDFDRAISIDPDYAAAWTRQALEIASTMHVKPPQEAPEILEHALQHASRAIELEPASPQVHTIFATLTYPTMRWQKAEQSYARALALERNADTLMHYSNMLMRTGRSTASAQVRAQGDGLLRRPERQYHWLRANVDIALAQFDSVRQKELQGSDYAKALVNLILELNNGTSESVRQAMSDFPATSMDYRVLLSPLLEVFDSRDDALALLETIASDTDSRWAYKHHNIALLAAYFGDPELALRVFEQDLRFTAVRFGALWYPMMSGVRQRPAFKQLVVDVNLVDYWREFGWADFCRPLGEEDFVCE